MKKQIITLVTVLIMAASTVFAADHGKHDMGKHAQMGSAAHEEIIDGVKAVFTVQTMKEAMKAMGMKMPKGVKETHHVSLSLQDMKDNSAITSGEARIKVIGPDKSEQVKELAGMHGHFGADIQMSAKGRYGIISKFKTADAKVRQVKFWYQVK